jgi:hypothetical protein
MLCEPRRLGEFRPTFETLAHKTEESDLGRRIQDNSILLGP